MTRTPLSIERDALLDLGRSMKLEWLETDGLGGFASSTVLLCPARRYHALLASPRPGGPRRYAWLSRFDETLVVAGHELPLSMARYTGLWAPLGHQALESFELVPWPRWTWLFGRMRVVRELLLARGDGAVLVRWSVRGTDAPVTLRLRPLLPFREADALTVENGALDPRVEPFSGGVSCQPYAELPRIALWLDGDPRFTRDPVWYRGIEYPLDLERGYDGHEDQFSPGHFEIEIEDGGDALAQANLGAPLGDARARWRRETARRAAQADEAGPGLRGALSLSADAFLYRAPDARLGVVAGWPWFLEWGRDTFLSLPGLLAARGQNDALGDALAGALRFLKNGLLPNVFGAEPADSHYGSVDASLWFARAVRLHEQAGAPTAQVAERFLPALLHIATHYRDGTGLGLRADPSGLLRAGAPELNATWMDARIDGVPVTPRDGMAVEIEALWIFLLSYLEHLFDAVGRQGEARPWRELRTRASAAFLERFWLAKEERLADVWRPDGLDRALRPNQVIAAALEWSPLSRAQRGLVARAARGALLTPRGLRTLEPSDRAYLGRYGGGTAERDRAYHQGTVWPWLMGFFVEAWMRGIGDGPEERAWLRARLEDFAPHLAEAGLGHVSEVFDGDAPHAPGGCFAQAWSTAELLRALALVEEPLA